MKRIGRGEGEAVQKKVDDSHGGRTVEVVWYR
jgi:hypothetical protein